MLQGHCTKSKCHISAITATVIVTTDAVMFGHHWKMPWTAAFHSRQSLESANCERITVSQATVVASDSLHGVASQCPSIRTNRKLQNVGNLCWTLDHVFYSMERSPMITAARSFTYLQRSATLHCGNFRRLLHFHIYQKFIFKLNIVNISM